MPDFRKNPDPADETSPIPTMPFSIAADLPAVEPQQNQEDVETTKRAQAYWHPAWETVQTMFEEKIASYRAHGGAITHQDLSPEEFKIRMMTDAFVANDLEEIMEDVKRAVEQVESRPKPGKRSQQGG